MNVKELLTHILSLSSKDRLTLLTSIIRYVIDSGEVESSSLRTQLRIIDGE